MVTLKFSFGRPITPEYFYNREEEIARILLRLGTIKNGIRNDLTLVGPRRAGKSSILGYLQWKLNEEGILPVIMDCEGLDVVSFLKVYGNVIIEKKIESMGLMQRFATRLRRGFTEGLSVMSEAHGKIKAVEGGSSAQEFLRFRIEFEKSTYHRAYKDDDVEELFDRTIDLVDNLEDKCVVMFDEFQDTAMYSLSRGDFHANFRSKIKDQRNVSYLFTGSAIGMMDDIFADPRNPMAGGAEIIYVEPFDEVSSTSFLIDRFEDAGRDISEETTRYVYEKLGGFPLYLNWIGLRVCDLVGEKRKVTLNIVKKVIEEIYTPQSPIYHMIEKQLVKLGYKTRDIMRCMALGYQTPSEISRESAVKNVYVYLERLQKYGLVQKHDGGYELIDPVISEHLRRIGEL